MKVDCHLCKTRGVLALLDNTATRPLFRCSVCGGELNIPFEIKQTSQEIPKNLADAAKLHSQVLYEAAILLFGVMSKSYISANYLTGKKDRDKLFNLDYKLDKDLVEEYQAHLTKLAFSRVRQVLDVLPPEVAEAEELDWKEDLERFKEAKKWDGLQEL